MTTKIHVDFETRSTIDLRQVGVYAYALHPSTEIQCMAWAIDDFPIQLWTPSEPFPQTLHDVMSEDGVELWAHNANFERIIWREVGYFHDFPLLDMEQWHCSAVQCAAMGLPRSLEHAAIALKFVYHKDKAGHALMMQMSRPRSQDPLTWWDDEDKLDKLYAYCRQDVRVEREIAVHTRRLDSTERQTYLLDQRMNDQGIRVDIPLILASKGIALEGIARANLVIDQHTNGEVERVTQVQRMKKWLRSQGVNTKSLAKSNVTELLQKPLPYAAEQVLIARQEAGKSSVAKLDRMLDGLVGDRLPGLLLYHGAHTGRWAGRRVQPHNFPRPTVKNAESKIPLIMNGRYDEIDLGSNPVDVVASLLRGMIIGDPDLYVGDYSAIEAIVLAWLAGEDALVDRFASGENVYLVEGQTVGATRQHGKAIILGCGFGMGAVKFVANAKTVFGLDVTYAEAFGFVEGYRERYTKIPEFWYALQKAYDDVIHARSHESVQVGRLSILRKGRYIWVTLPSGRPLCYVGTEMDKDGQLTVMRTNSQTGKMERRRIWGGVLAENVTQAVARDIMAEGMKRLDVEGYHPILTVHDEIICEPNVPDPALDKFLSIMSEAPEWATGLPVFADGFVAARYRKG